MATTYRGYKLSYNSAEYTISVDTINVRRTKNETTTVQITPTGAKWKQVFGSGKMSWVFSFTLTERALLTFFQNAYDAAVAGATLILSEEEDDASYTEYTVIINQPKSTTDTIGAGATDKGLSVEVLEA